MRSGVHTKLMLADKSLPVYEVGNQFNVDITLIQDKTKVYKSILTSLLHY